MKALLFGPNGQVGRCLSQDLSRIGTVYCFGRDSVDLSDSKAIQSVIEDNKPDVVVNAAAYTAVDKAESDPETAYLVNAAAPKAMAQACCKVNTWLVHYSTDYVFNGDKTTAYLEEDETDPRSVYGHTKLQGEEFIQGSHDRYLIFRTSWVYANHGKNFLNTMFGLAEQRDELTIVDDQHGTPTSAMCISAATADILEQILANNKFDSSISGVYHMTCAGFTNWYEFALQIFRHTGYLDRIKVKPIPTSLFPTPAVRPRYSVLSNQKLNDTFGINLPGWEQALSDCLSERPTD